MMFALQVSNKTIKSRTLKCLYDLIMIKVFIGIKLVLIILSQISACFIPKKKKYFFSNSFAF